MKKENIEAKHYSVPEVKVQSVTPRSRIMSGSGGLEGEHESFTIIKGQTWE